MFDGGHMPGFDGLIRHVRVIQDCNNRVLQVRHAYNTSAVWERRGLLNTRDGKNTRM